MSSSSGRIADAITTLAQLAITEPGSEPLVLSHPRNLKHGSPLIWNLPYEVSLSQKYGEKSNIEEWKRSYAALDSPEHYFSGDLRACNQEIMRLLKKLIHLEGFLVQFAMEGLNDKGFENEWREYSAEKRKEMVLNGLVRAAFQAPREQSRCDCPELTTSNLEGRGLIDLYRAIIAHDDTGDRCLKTLFLFQHPAIDIEYPDDPSASDLEKATRYLRLVLRTFFIVETLLGILEEFNGFPPNDISLEQEEEKEREGLGECLVCCTNGEGVMNRCAGCRLALYCSTICQSREWPDHKRICRLRKPTCFDPAILMPTPRKPPIFVGCPDPEPGFVRSPALWRQIYCLAREESFEAAYQLEYRPTETVWIHITNLQDRMSFCIARRRAMASGDPLAVSRMRCSLTHYIQNTDLGNTITAEHIRSQLQREYPGVDLPIEHVCGEHWPLEQRPSNEESLDEMKYAKWRDDLAERKRAEGGARLGVDGREEGRMARGMNVRELLPWFQREMGMGDNGEVVGVPWMTFMDFIPQ
ncbi:MYND-type domain-containing protein [Favolaschia claudopus]|uniref:MYND-type domain-containing protein n=2 Tax=Favolaschia claudopus TaxID=2862362 RepID=A0AAW0AET1_9AGAR